MKLDESSTLGEVCDLVKVMTGYGLQPEQVEVWLLAYIRTKERIQSRTELDMAILQWYRRETGDAEREVSLKEVARALGVSRERVRQIEARGLRKLLERTNSFRKKD